MRRKRPDGYMLWNIEEKNLIAKLSEKCYTIKDLRTAIKSSNNSRLNQRTYQSIYGYLRRANLLNFSDNYEEETKEIKYKVIKK